MQSMIVWLTSSLSERTAICMKKTKTTIVTNYEFGELPSTNS